jgi:hypothetical protein
MSNVIELTKEDIKRKVEPFIYSRLIERGYAQKYIASRDLLTANRFDLGLKLAYLSYKNVLPELATEIYHHDIRSQTLGKYQEYGNDEKSSFEIYLEHFDKTFNDIKNNGFDENKSLIPLSSKGSILNGAHRLASAIFLGLDVACVQTELDEICPDYKYFLDRNVPEDILDIGALLFGDYAENSYLAFLWPSGRQNYNHTELLFTDVVYKKTIKLNSNGAFNLLVELYKHMDWVGATNSNFSGAHKKLMECFTDFDEFTIILFQCDSLEKVQQLKKRVRDINKIGFSSVHITDTKEEVNRISRLIFNKNALHFLNYAEPYKFKSTTKMVQSLFVLGKEILKKLVLDGSMTLSVYGLREARDIDYFSEQSNITYEGEFDFEAHDSQLKFHKIEKHELIYNPKYYFEYLGVRFVSFKQTFEFKKNRNEIKDKNDCQMMALLIDKNSFRYVYANLKQKIFYKKLIIKSRLKEAAFVFLRVTGTYESTRTLYRKLKGRS